MCCTACETGPVMVQAGRLGEEVVVRCPHCGAIVILDSDPGAPQSFPINRAKVPETLYVCSDFYGRHHRPIGRALLN